MKKSEPLVSIIMPAYNAEKYIAEAIQSVIDQTYKNWELIIVNDGSTDSTEEIINSFDDDRIQSITQKNRGVSAARNRGLDIAQGEYVTFLDADDVLPVESIEKRSNLLNTNSSLGMVHGIVSIRDENLCIERKQYEPFKLDNLFQKCLSLNQQLFFNPGYMVRYKYMQDIRFKEGMSHAEDILFLIFLSSKNLSYLSLSEPTYLYRVTQSSAMSNMFGWRKGYFDLLENVMNLNEIRYKDTLIMRLKIFRMLLSWHIKTKHFSGILELSKIMSY